MASAPLWRTAWRAAPRAAGEQIFEKMLSGMYLGPIAREVLLDLNDAAPFLTATARAALEADATITTEKLSYIDSSRSAVVAKTICGVCIVSSRLTPLPSPLASCSVPGLERVREVAATVFKGEAVSDQALAIMKEVCQLIGLRSAKLAAAGAPSQTNTRSEGRQCGVSLLLMPPTLCLRRRVRGDAEDGIQLRPHRCGR